MKKSFFGIKLVFVLILLILATILIVQNTKLADISVFFWGFSAPVIAVVLVSLLIGFLLGVLVFSFASGGKKNKGDAGRRADLSDQNVPADFSKKKK